MRKKIKRKLIIIFISILFASKKANTSPLPGADGFLCRPSNQHISRASKGTSAVLREHPNNENKPVSYYVSELDSIFDDIQLQRKYKHSDDFGIYDNYNPVNRKLFRDDHMKSVKPKDGTFHGYPAIHYLDETTGLNVIINKTTKRFVSG